MSASGLYLIKAGTVGTSLAFQNGLLGLQIPPKLLFGVLLYIGSFLLSLLVMSKMKLSVFYPASAGVAMMLSCVFGYFFLKEQIAVSQFIGIAVILVGVIILSVK